MAFTSALKLSLLLPACFATGPQRSLRSLQGWDAKYDWTKRVFKSRRKYLDTLIYFLSDTVGLRDPDHGARRPLGYAVNEIEDFMTRFHQEEEDGKFAFFELMQDGEWQTYQTYAEEATKLENCVNALKDKAKEQVESKEAIDYSSNGKSVWISYTDGISRGASVSVRASRYYFDVLFDQTRSWEDYRKTRSRHKYTESSQMSPLEIYEVFKPFFDKGQDCYFPRHKDLESWDRPSHYDINTFGLEGRRWN